MYAWEQVRQYPEVVLVEGLFDYAVLSQAGFHNVTCSMGNHLNVHQYRQLCDLREPLMPTQTVVASRRRNRLPRKIQKLNLLELTGGCRMNGWFAKVGLNWT